MKYIIEFEDEPCEYEGGRLFYTCKQIPYWSVDKSKINKLPPYTEPDRQAVEDEVWELVRIITDMTEKQREECFGKSTCDLDEYLTYQEAKARYEEWKKEKDEIRVGDEVEPKIKDGYDEKGVVLRLYQPKQYKPLADVLWRDETVDTMVVVEKLVRTGRHFDEVEELLKKMKED